MVIVDGQPFVEVDGDTEETGVGVNHETLVPSPQVVQDRGLVEVSQVGHILQLVELGHQLFALLSRRRWIHRVVI